MAVLQRERNMKTIFIIILVFFSINSFGQEWKNVKGKPKDLKESFEYLDKMFDDTTKYTYMTLPSDVVFGKLYSFGLGMWIRNNWGLWGNSDLKKYFIENGINHPDIISGIILSEYYNYLNHIPYELKREVDSSLLQMTNKELVEKMESDMTKSNELLKYYPIDDTIVVYVTVTKKKFLKTEKESVRAIAKVIKHENSELIVELLKIPIKKKQSTNYEAGQKINVDPYWCELIPPKNWKWN
ncbi:MAG TPA: hypothetical protein PLF45_04650 [Bacteroidales bacterium]|jgi:hypothetical protein|nr:hypothetical protein [Bacteroidales bacterium]HNV17329.1 hypothetical protein [Bacteroidales bacterium]HOX79656.1 hypothetical protein [Bacteroidales bacterium]HPL33977.1 hypothetical protein [Bacteroidales bacterium]HPN49176.1 hypothetical protein [Bacteroidales bacterium]